MYQKQNDNIKIELIILLFDLFNRKQFLPYIKNLQIIS